MKNPSLRSDIRLPLSARDDSAPGLLAAVAAVCGAAVLLCAVAAANGFPLPWDDTRAYYMAGRSAVEHALSILARLFPDPGGAPAESFPAADPFRTVAAIRSAYYGAFLYVLNALHSFWLVALVQGLVASYVAFVFCRVTIEDRVVPVFLAAVLALTLLTSLPWYTGQLMPDVFTGVTVLCVALLAFYRDRMTGAETAALAAILLASLTFHHVHLYLTVGLGVVALAIKLLGRRPLRDLAVTGTLLGALVAAGTAASLAVSYVGFRELSLTPQRLPILLARVLADGPGRAYLEENCPALDYAVCDSLDGLPDGALAILWAPNGIHMEKTPEVRDRIRAEEMAIVAASIREYPLWQATASLRNWVTQLGLFGLMDIDWRGSAHVRPDDPLVVVQGTPDEEPLLWWMSTVHYVVVGLSLLAIGLCARQWIGPRGDARLRGVVAVVAAGLLLNAFLCGVLAEPMHRFGARVIWLVPLLAVPLLVRRLREAPAGGGVQRIRLE